MKLRVNIVTSDRGWILERMAAELAERLPYVKYGDGPDPAALINYYMTYSCWHERISPIETGFFTHLEKDHNASQQFFNVAQKLDYCICMSGIYESILRSRGIDNVISIIPGVDQESFRPRLQIGVVGRTYHTGRKGEALVKSLMDLEWIDWHFTGEGWPGPALNLADDEMPSFYRKLDYLLVPAFYEGGPMSLLEALACGTRVIAPPIGLVAEFPHIEYRTGDVSDLRRVLAGLYEEKRALAKSVRNVTWDAWARGHDWVFRMLARESGVEETGKRQLAAPKRRHIVLALHGDEKINKGGPSSRVPHLANLLFEQGEFAPAVWHPRELWPTGVELAHIFNLWKLDSCKTCVLSAFRNRQPIILSPIFLDLSKTGFAKSILDIFKAAPAPADLENKLGRALAAREIDTSGDLRKKEIFPGQFDQIRDILSKVDRVIFLSEHERALFQSLDLPARESVIIRNPVQSGLYAAATPELFTSTYNVHGYILCVGRLELRKNQLMLAYALKDLDAPLVFIGHGLDEEYRDLVRRYGPANTLFIDRLEPNSEMLASAYAGAAVYCLPSWAEGASLSALEAAAAGCNMVLSDSSSEKEYFGDFARYCDPFDPVSIRDAILDALAHPLEPARKEALKEFVATNYSWTRHLKETISLYEAVIESRAIAEGHEKERPLPPLYVDLTTSAHHQGPPMGMARVEQFYGLNILEHYPGEVRFILWNKPNDRFIPVEIWQFFDNSYKELAFANTPFPAKTEDDDDESFFQTGSNLLVMGGTWTFTNNYAASLYNLVRENRLNLAAFIHDLVPVKFSCWYPRLHREDFIRNTTTLINIASRLFADSECTRKDIKEFCAERILSCPPIDVVRFGDNILTAGTLNAPNLEEIEEVSHGEPFALFVSDLNIRKNHAMLLAIWRNLVAKYGLERVPHLVCVGKPGLQSDIFIALADREEMLQDRLHIKHGIDDATLEWLYKNCLFTVYPSRYEGWGLPVGESLAHGKITIASSASSIPEIAPEYTDLIDPDDFKAWESRIESYIFNPELRHAREQQVRQYKPVTWDESTRSFLKSLKNPAPNPVEYPVCPLNRKIRVGQGCDYLGQGWKFLEEKGATSVGSQAVVIARLWLKHDSAIMSIRCRARLPKGKRVVSVPVRVNGQHAAILTLTESESDQRIEMLGLAASESGFSDARISFKIPDGLIEEDEQGESAVEIFSFTFEPVALPEEIYGKALNFLESCLGLDRMNILYLLNRRSDLRVLLSDDRECGAYRIFLWAWRYGHAEEPILRRGIRAMREKIRKLIMTSHSETDIPGFNELCRMIWKMRPDLHIWDISTSEGQTSLLSWLVKYGVKEYDLEEFLPVLLEEIKSGLEKQKKSQL